MLRASMTQDDTSIGESEIRSALDRIVSSPTFQGTPQLASFLTFVVDRTLAGEASGLKGYTIATQALGRPDHFDPQLDPIVRVEAGRLRKALAAYYAGPGAGDPIRLSIPLGGYVPRFERAAGPEVAMPVAEDGDVAQDDAAAAPPADPAPAGEPPVGGGMRRRRLGVPPWLSGIAAGCVAVSIGLFVHMGVETHPLIHGLERTQGAPAPAGLGDGRPVVLLRPLEGSPTAAPAVDAPVLRSLVLDGLARFEEIAVVDGATASASAPADRYVLDLKSDQSGANGVTARLHHEPSGKVVWVRSFDPTMRTDPTASVEGDLARQIATSIGQPYGVLFSDLRHREGLDQRLRCTILAYDHWRNPSAASHAQARECLEAVVAAQPQNATAFANLTYLYIEEYRVGYNPRPDPLDRAVRAARQAVDLAPESPRSNQAMMSALFVRNDVDAAIARGRRALMLNPYDTDILADVGSKLVQAGRYREGAELIQRAAAANAADPPWYDFFLFLAAFMEDDWTNAKLAAARIEAPDYVLGLVAKIIAAGRDQRDASSLIARLLKIQPEFASSPQAVLAKRNFDPMIQSRLLEGLRLAGLRA